MKTQAELRRIKSTIDNSHFPVCFIEREQYLELLEQMIVLQYFIRRWYHFLQIVRSSSMDAWLKASVGSELDDFIYGDQPYTMSIHEQIQRSRLVQG